MAEEFIGGPKFVRTGINKISVLNMVFLSVSLKK
jgi:hypothetical protein